MMAPEGAAETDDTRGCTSLSVHLLTKGAALRTLSSYVQTGAFIHMCKATVVHYYTGASASAHGRNLSELSEGRTKAAEYTKVQVGGLGLTHTGAQTRTPRPRPHEDAKTFALTFERVLGADTFSARKDARRT